MKFSTLTSLLSTVSTALALTGFVANDFTEEGCRDVIFIWARASTEIGNMGETVGPILSDKLKYHYGDERVATQGVDYRALLTTNLLPGGCDPKEAAKMYDLINDAANKCPDSKIVIGGYSQGCSLTHRSVEKLTPTVSKQISAIVMFGDPQNKADGGRINNFPPDKTKIICQATDVVCDGILIITPQHAEYFTRIQEGYDFILDKTHI